MVTEEPSKILVVDDSPQISKALNDLLSASGYSVRTAPSGERALQIRESTAFDLIITDLKMTGMTGIDLARQVLQTTPHLPIVILTGFGDMDSVISALRLGVADYLKKPFSIDEVMSVVEREIAKSKAARLRRLTRGRPRSRRACISLAGAIWSRSRPCSRGCARRPRPSRPCWWSRPVTSSRPRA
jgi:DNA-binding NtrC family response regulator